MRILTPIICFLILCALMFGGGYYIGSTRGEPEVIFRDKIKWQDRIIYRDYKHLTFDKCKQQLACYDTSRPSLDIEKIDGDLFKLNAGLCERKWDREVKIQCGSSGNWKFYAGAGAAGMLAGLLLMH